MKNSLVSLKKVSVSLNRQANILLANNNKQDRNRAKNVKLVKNIVDYVSKNIGTDTLIQVNAQSKTSETYNLGEISEKMLEYALTDDISATKSLDKGFDCVLNDGAMVEFKSLVNNKPNAISGYHRIYVLMVKTTGSGIYEIPAKSALTLKGERLDKALVMRYGKLNAKLSTRLGL